MVLSDRFGGKTPASFAKKIALYVAGFGLGSLLLSVALGLLATCAAESVLPAGEEAPTLSASAIIGPKTPRGTTPAMRGKPPSKAPRPRGNEGETPGSEL